MNAIELQQWLGAHGHPVTVDGKPGEQTRAAIVAAFTNKCAEAVTDDVVQALADRLQCSAKQLRAMAKVESGGSAYDDQGRPKILFERHLFHRLTNGAHSPSSFSQPKGGGYNEPSWDKLTRAACVDADAAFAATSWGKFQVLGLHWRALGYSSPISMAYTAVISEAGHYEMLARYIEHNGLAGALRRLSTNPADNVALARGYNGPAFRNFKYDDKLAAAMA